MKYKQVIINRYYKYSKHLSSYCFLPSLEERDFIKKWLKRWLEKDTLTINCERGHNNILIINVVAI